MSRTLSIEIETLTPLWTAGADSKIMDRLHETGIIGSLRWWYGAMIQGLGGCAGNHEKGGCQFDADEYAKHPELPKRERLKKAGLCDVCQLFGATGWKRRFNMELEIDQEKQKQLFSHFYNKNIRLPSGHVRQRQQKGKTTTWAGGWFLMPDSVMGKNILLKFRFNDPEDVEKMKILLSLIERHGTLGAKKASGNGVVRFRLKNNGTLAPAPVSAVFPWATSVTGGEKSPYPDLRDFIFVKVRFTPPSEKWWFCLPENKNALQKKVTDKKNRETAQTGNPEKQKVEDIFNIIIGKNFSPISPTIRNWLRYEREGKLNYEMDKYLFGSGGADAFASKINVSHAYRIDPQKNLWEFRIWGWLPINNEGMPDEGRRRFLLACLRRELRSSAFINYISRNCHKFDPFQLQSQSCNSETGLNYLQTLLQEKEGAAT